MPVVEWLYASPARKISAHWCQSLAWLFVLHLAEERGLFRANGVEVELIELASSGDVALAYQPGQIDIGTSTTVDLVTTRHISDKTPQIFSINDFSNGAGIVF